jgi:polysaccharide pyruvyl transferase WcaK-like protein
LLDTADFKKNHATKIEVLLKKSNKRKVGISLITTNILDLDSLIINQLSEIIDKYHTYFDFYFLPFYTEPGMRNDLDMAKDLEKRIKNRTSFTIIPYNIGADGFHYFFYKLDFAISMRFHAQVFSYKANIPFFGISYDEKCKSFMSQINASFVSTSDIEENNLFTLLEEKLLGVLK